MRKWVTLARHNRWVRNCSITETSDGTGKNHRFTATIRGFRNWKIYQGRAYPEEVGLVIKLVRCIRDKIEADESAAVFTAENEYCRSEEELRQRIEEVNSE